jgi:hypothetical protein
MEEIHYINADSSNIELLVDYRVEFGIELHGMQSPEVIAELRKHLSDYYHKALSDGTYISCYAKSGNSIAGIGGLIIRHETGNFKNPSGVVGYFTGMFTSPAFRQKGVCSTILKLLIERAAIKGVHAFELHATKQGEPVYIKSGFVLHHEPTYRMNLNA